MDGHGCICGLYHTSQKALYGTNNYQATLYWDLTIACITVQKSTT